MKNTGMNQEEIVLTGELTIHNVSQLKDKLLASIENNVSTTIRIGEATEVDAAFLQMLCAAHRTALNAGKSLRLDSGTSEIFQRQLEDAGFVRHIGCLRDCNNSCIWVAVEH